MHFYAFMIMFSYSNILYVCHEINIYEANGAKTEINSDLQEIWSEMVNYRAKCKTISPGLRHVLDLHAWITFGHPPAPQLQSFRALPLAHGV